MSNPASSRAGNPRLDYRGATDALQRPPTDGAARPRRPAALRAPRPSNEVRSRPGDIRATATIDYQDGRDRCAASRDDVHGREGHRFATEDVADYLYEDRRSETPGSHAMSDSTRFSPASSTTNLSELGYPARDEKELEVCESGDNLRRRLSGLTLNSSFADDDEPSRYMASSQNLQPDIVPELSRRPWPVPIQRRIPGTAGQQDHMGENSTRSHLIRFGVTNQRMGCSSCSFKRESSLSFWELDKAEQRWFHLEGSNQKIWSPTLDEID